MSETHFWRPLLSLEDLASQDLQVSYNRKHNFDASCSHLKVLPHRAFSNSYIREHAFDVSCSHLKVLPHSAFSAFLYKRRTFDAYCCHLKALSHRAVSTFLYQKTHVWCLLLSLEGLASQNLFKSPRSEFTLLMSLALTSRPCLTELSQVSDIRTHTCGASCSHLKALPHRAFSSFLCQKTLFW